MRGLCTEEYAKKFVQSKIRVNKGLKQVNK